MLTLRCYRQRYRKWKREYDEVYGKFIDKGRVPDPVKIAILDTGINREHPELEAHGSRITATRNFHDPTKKGVFDGNGHGTFTAGLIFDYAPDLELYVAKIVDRENAAFDVKVVANVSNSAKNPPQKIIKGTVIVY